MDIFEAISTEDGWNAEFSQIATSLLAAITKFDFLMAFSIANNLLGFTKGLTISLQSQAQGICNEVDSVKRLLQDVRSNIDTYT